MRYFPWILFNICYQETMLNVKFNFILVFCSIRFENIMLWWYQYKIANSCVLQRNISLFYLRVLQSGITYLPIPGRGCIADFPLGRSDARTSVSTMRWVFLNVGIRLTPLRWIHICGSLLEESSLVTIRRRLVNGNRPVTTTSSSGLLDVS